MVQTGLTQNHIIRGWAMKYGNLLLILLLLPIVYAINWEDGLELYLPFNQSSDNKYNSNESTLYIDAVNLLALYPFANYFHKLI